MNIQQARFWVSLPEFPMLLDSHVTGCFSHVGIFIANFPLRIRHYTICCSGPAINLELINFMRPVKPWGCPSSVLSGQSFPCVQARDSAVSPTDELSASVLAAGDELRECKGTRHFLIYCL